MQHLAVPRRQGWYPNFTHAFVAFTYVCVACYLHKELVAAAEQNRQRKPTLHCDLGISDLPALLQLALVGQLSLIDL